MVVKERSDSEMEDIPFQEDKKGGYSRKRKV